METLKKIPSLDGHFFSIRLPLFILFPYPLQNLLPGITCLDALWELQVWEENPMPNKVGIDFLLMSPCYYDNYRLLDALCSLYFVEIEVLNLVQILETLQMASGS